jgi:hypothetical protein
MEVNILRWSRVSIAIMGLFSAMTAVLVVMLFTGCSERKSSSDIAGTWIRFDYQRNRFEMILDPSTGSYELDFTDDGRWDVRGKCVISDGQISFVDTAGEKSCPEMKGEYTFFVHENILHLWLIEDPCSGRDWVMPGDWLCENYEELMEQYSRAIFTDSTDEEALYQRGRLLAAVRENEKAFQDLDRAIQLGLERAEAYAHRGFTRMWISRDYEGALADYDRAIELDPTLVKAYVQRGRVKMEMDDKRGACEDWEAAFELGYLAAEKLMRHHCRYIFKDRYLKSKNNKERSEQGQQE